MSRTTNKTAKTILIVLWVLIAAWGIYAWVERNEAHRRLEIKKAAVATQMQMLNQELRDVREKHGMTSARYSREQQIYQEMTRLYESVDNEILAKYARDSADDARVMSRKMQDIETKYPR